MENEKIINAVNDYKNILNGSNKKYSLYDIKIIYDALKRFVLTDHTVYTTFIDNVANFFKNHGFDVFMDNDNINYMIVNN